MDRLDEATRYALKKYLTGEAHHPALTPTTRRMLEVWLFADENHDELEALRIVVEEADSEPLAELIEAKGELRTPDARAFVAARVRGEPRKRGDKLRTEAVLRRINLFLEIQHHMHTFQERQADALRRAIKTRTSFVEGALKIYEEHNGGEEPGGEMREFLDQLWREAESGLRDDFKKGRAELREVLETLGFALGPAFDAQKARRNTK